MRHILLVVAFVLLCSFFAYVYLGLSLPIQLIHITVPYLIKNGLVLYRDIVYHHTPLMQFILTGFYTTFGYTFFAYRLYFLLTVLLTLFFVYKSGSYLSQKSGFFAVLFFTIFYLPFFSDSQLEEVTVAFFSSISLYLFVRYIKTNKDKYIFLSGASIGAAIMTKQVVAVLAPVIFIYLFVKKIREERWALNIEIWWFSLGLSSVIGIISLYFFLQNAFIDFFYWNILFNLTTYAKDAPVASASEGLKVAFIFTSFVFPLLFIYKKKYLSSFEREAVIVLVLFAFGLLFGLLPSFYINRLRGLFVISSVGYGFLFAKLISMSSKFSDKNFGLFSKTSFIILIVFTLVSIPYVQNLFEYIQSFPGKPYNIVDYNKDDLKAVVWLKKNTVKDEKIMNLGNHYILFLSQRLPANKYLWPIPWLLKPYDKSAREIEMDPPKFVIDSKLNHVDYPQVPSLNDWPFYEFLDENYMMAAKFGDVRIYKIKKLIKI
ncbi:MAG: glycosyltransferase family 39 protein [Candidatus Levybacteria bacterium]|nr:glycosyltransferase family 39 protein [Candidatus Levybacteria bacterium]